MIRNYNIYRSPGVIGKPIINKLALAQFMQVSTEYEFIVANVDRVLSAVVDSHILNQEVCIDGEYAVSNYIPLEVSTTPIAGTYEEIVKHFRESSELLQKEDARAGDSNHIHVIANPYEDEGHVAFALPAEEIFKSLVVLVLRNYSALRYISGSWGKLVVRSNDYSNINPPGEKIRQGESDAMWRWSDRNEMPTWERGSILRPYWVEDNVCHVEYRACDGNFSPHFLATIACIMKALLLKSVDMVNYNVSVEEFRNENINCLREIARKGFLLDQSMFRERIDVLVDDILPYLPIIEALEVEQNIRKLYKMPPWSFRIKNNFDGHEWFTQLDYYLSGGTNYGDKELNNRYIQALVGNKIPPQKTVIEFEQTLADHLGVDPNEVRTVRKQLGSRLVKWQKNRLIWMG